MRILNDNSMKEWNGLDKDVIVLLGNIKDKETGERHDKVLEFGIGKANFDLGFTGQLLVKCPKSKVKRFLESFPIIEGVKYWQTTHYWDGAAT